jgi:hypothetical protein
LFVQTEAVGVLNQLSGRDFTHSRHVVWDASGITLAAKTKVGMASRVSGGRKVRRVALEK